jgi:HD-GYP domain-containing protein (c-di-GMP phosphodiesterase class II)
VNSAAASRVSYVWGVPAMTLAVLLAAAVRLPMPAWTGSLTLSAATWLLLITLAERAPAVLGRGGRVRLTTMFDFGALLCFSAVPAALLAGLGRTVAALAGGRPLRTTVRESAEAMLAIVVAGAVLFERGGSAGIAAHPATLLFAPTLIAMGVFALVSAGLAAWRRATLADRAGGPGVAAQDRIHTSVLALPFGVAFAWLESIAGPAAGACALVLVLMARAAEPAAPTRAVAPVAVTTPREDGPDPQLETVRLLMSAIDAFDPFTRGHSARVARASVGVARHLGLPDDEVRQIEYAALLHDIGRTAIHLDILARPGTLSGEERQVLNTHPTVGSDIVRRIPGLESAAVLIQAHHEQPDGRGYPRGLGGEAIPLGARIIMVAAAFDAMTRERPYRRGLGASAAYDELRRHAGTQFFPEVVEAYIALHTSGALDMAAEDDTGDLATARDAEMGRRAA